jgi:hypothetical protein
MQSFLTRRCRASPDPVKEIGMPIDPAALARNLSSLADLDAEQDLARAMQQLVSAAKALLGVDGAGLMLADERGDLRWATASDQQTQIVEEGQERLGQGPCVNAFAEHAPMAMRDATKEPHWGKITDVVTGQEMRASLSVPVQLEGGPIGSLDLYSAKPRDWDQAEISAAQVLDRAKEGAQPPGWEPLGQNRIDRQPGRSGRTPSVTASANPLMWRMGCIATVGIGVGRAGSRAALYSAVGG